MGKTTLVVNLALKSKVPFYLFETEMDRVVLAENMIYAAAELDSKLMRQGKITDDDIGLANYKAEWLSEADFWIDNTPTLTPSFLRAEIGRRIALTGRGVFCIDHIQNIRTDGKSRGAREDMNEISRSLKEIAREHAIPLVALSHLTREVEKRVDKRPKDADLRESGSIESDADTTLHMYCHGHYNRDFPYQNVTEIGIGKNRHGPANVTKLIYYDRTTGKVDDLDAQGKQDYMGAL